VEVMSEVFKPNLMQKHTRIRVYKILVRSVLTYGSEAWMIGEREESRITAAEMKFMRQTAGYTHMDHTRNTDIMKELNTEPVMNLTDLTVLIENATFLGCLVQEFHFKCYIINQKKIHRKTLQVLE
jgi:hypothetical protein